MNKSISEMAIAVMVLVALAAFAMPASASGDPGAGCPVDTKYHDTINGSIYLGFDPEAGPGQPGQPLTKTFNNVPDGIKLAKVYFGIWMGSPGNGGKFNMTIVNSSGSYTTPTYQSCDPCPGEPCSGYQDERCDMLNWSGNVPPNVPSGDIHGYTTGCAVQSYSFDATPYITPGTNTITVDGSEHCPNCTYSDGRVYAIALLVVYENAALPEITYWINEGAAYMEVGSDCDGHDDHTSASYYFNGTHISNPTIASYEVLGWPHVFNSYENSAYTKFNSIDIGAPDYEKVFYVRYDNIIDDSNLDPTSNLMEYYDPGGYYERANVAWLVVKGNGTDLTVPDIEFPPAMRPDNGYTINATIKNIGIDPAGSFSVSLYVNDILNGTVPVPELGGGANKTVSFPVNLPYGCYDFKVVADCYNQVAESDENNNETSRDRQVGYYIVVDGNDGFDALLAEVAGGTLPSNTVVKVGDTYYIHNMDIENCAGAGIRIENTNVPFVISSCTVHDCSGEGAIYLRNLVDGKINDSTVEDNTMKGIRLMNCSHVEINNNLVQNNWKYGIDVYMEAMPTVDCEFINITCNTLIGNEYGIEMYGDNCIVRGNIIRNSDTYGIYMTGNNSKVYNNTIENSGGYGLKLDNLSTTPCFDNDLYWNDIIDNNGVGVQAYDSGTTNIWNTPTQVNYPYKGSSTWYSYTGNYWDNNRDPNDLDGIMDGPYALAGGSSAQDSYPLSVEWRLCGDVNRDGFPDSSDILLLRSRVSQGTALCNEWAGDMNCDDFPDSSDILLLRSRVSQGTTLNCCKDC